MPFLYIAVDPEQVGDICWSSPQAHCILNHKFRNKAIPFKRDPVDAICAAICCHSHHAWLVMQQQTVWTVFAVWLTPLDIECLFMDNKIYWNGNSIYVSTCLMRKPDEVVRAFVFIVSLSLQQFLNAASNI